MTIKYSNRFASIYGRTDGLTPSAGQIGELIQTAIGNQTVAVSSNTYADIPTSTLILTAGTWIIKLDSKITSASLGAGDGRIAIRRSDNVVILEREFQESINATVTQNVTMSDRLVLAATTTFKLSFFCEGGGGGNMTMSSGSNNSYFTGLRVA